MHKPKRKHIFLLIYTFLLIAFTVYISLDTFVITRVYSQATTASSSSSTASAVTQSATGNTQAQSSEASSDATITDTSYSDENIQITITEERIYNTTVYVADIQVSSPEYLKTAFAQNAYGKNVTDTTSDIASSVNAILAINGDYYGAQESGYVIRNGVLYRSEGTSGQEDLVIYSDGSFQIIDEGSVSAETLLEEGAWQVLSFGPGLIENGELTVSVSEEVDKAMTSNPRTAIGIVDDCHYVFVVSDGRTSESEGLTLYQLAEYMQSLGVQTAYNLDGGGSSTMVFNGSVINNPTSNGKIKERSVSDIVYIGY
jgi:exopolysaccharide biosynthesis protein